MVMAKKTLLTKNEDDYGAFGTINPKMLEEAKVMIEAKLNEQPTSEPPKLTTIWSGIKMKYHFKYGKTCTRN